MVSEGRTRKARPSNNSKIPWKSVWLKYMAGEEMRSVTVSYKTKITVSSKEGFKLSDSEELQCLKNGQQKTDWTKEKLKIE